MPAGYATLSMPVRWFRMMIYLRLTHLHTHIAEDDIRAKVTYKWLQPVPLVIPALQICRQLCPEHISFNYTPAWLALKLQLKHTAASVFCLQKKTCGDKVCAYQTSPTAAGHFARLTIRFIRRCQLRRALNSSRVDTPDLPTAVVNYALENHIYHRVSSQLILSPVGRVNCRHFANQLLQITSSCCFLHINYC